MAAIAGSTIQHTGERRPTPAPARRNDMAERRALRAGIGNDLILAPGRGARRIVVARIAGQRTAATGTEDRQTAVPVEIADGTEGGTPAGGRIGSATAVSTVAIAGIEAAHWEEENPEAEPRRQATGVSPARAGAVAADGALEEEEEVGVVAGAGRKEN